MSTFNKAKHIKYWLRCLRTHLPHQYTSNDSQRTTLAFFILSALDLLGALGEKTTESERAAYIEWLYRCQHPDGGFRGFNGANVEEAPDAANSCWDPATLAATYFSLAALTVLGDGLKRVRRKECLNWVRRLQSNDGSFGDALMEGEKVDGARDVRFCYCAAAVRWMLRIGIEDKEDGVDDINVEALVGFITASQSYEGGIGKAPFHEAHAGWTYCGIAALSLLEQLPQAQNQSGVSSAGKTKIKSEFLDALTRWLVYRQTTSTQDEEFQVCVDDFPSPSNHTPVHNFKSREHETANRPPIFYVQGASADPHGVPHPIPTLISPPITSAPEPAQDELDCAGFNGRCNKVSDTCYCFWAGGALAILQKLHLLDFAASRNYLLSKAQHLVGGFGKYPGDSPDILHSYLGLAALAAMREPELRSIDSALCISLSAKESLLDRFSSRPAN